MPKCYYEEDFLENLRDYVLNGSDLLGAGCIQGIGLEKIKYEIIDGHIVLMTNYHLDYAQLRMNLMLLMSYQFPTIDDYHTIFSRQYYDFSMVDFKIDDNNLYMPSLIIGKSEDYNNEQLKNPLVIFEILTHKNKHLLNAKFEHYQKLETLQEYVVVDLNNPQIWLYHRENNWQAECLTIDDDLYLKSVDYAVKVSDIYKDIHFR